MEAKQKNKGWVIWLTGLPSSGKTTIAVRLEEYFKKNNHAVHRMDGDIARATISKDLGFSKKDRHENIERMTVVAQQLAEDGVNVLAAFISPYRRGRDLARRACFNFVEVYVKCDIEECIRRDVKGMYQQALEGKIENFTGVHDPYEEPLDSELIIETDKYSIEESAGQIIDFIEKYK